MRELRELSPKVVLAAVLVVAAGGVWAWALRETSTPTHTLVTAERSAWESSARGGGR